MDRDLADGVDLFDESAQVRWLSGRYSVDGIGGWDAGGSDARGQRRPAALGGRALRNRGRLAALHLKCLRPSWQRTGDGPVDRARRYDDEHDGGDLADHDVPIVDHPCDNDHPATFVPDHGEGGNHIHSAVYAAADLDHPDLSERAPGHLVAV